MKTSDVLACSFRSWYNSFCDLTEESIIIPLPEHFIRYLHTDGLVLPESATHGIYSKASNVAMDGEEDDEDLRDEDLLDQYEADWSTAEAKSSSQAPDFGDFDEKVNTAIKALGGRVFPKLNWSSPKDATWISFDKSLMCTCPSDVYLLLKSSDFVAHDLDLPFSGCEDLSSDNAPPTVQYVLVLRRWRPPVPSTEFRVFVHNKKILGICQRDPGKFHRHIPEEKESIREDVCAFFDKTVSPRFPLDSYVFDILRPLKGSIRLVDFNPFGSVTDGLMFSWEELEQMASDSQSKIEIRCVESEDGVKISEYANYAFPQDIQDLTAGEDPYKLMDLLKLGSKQDLSSESGSDQEENHTTTQDSGTSQS